MEKILEPLFESMDISEDEKVALQEAFDKAVIKKTAELIDEAVEKELQEKTQALEEEYKEKVEFLTESLDGYLDTIVEEFVEENKPLYEQAIAEEKVKALLEHFDAMVKLSGIEILEIQEAKEQKELDESAETKIQDLEETVSKLAEKLTEAKQEADKYLQAGVINEISEGLTVLEKAKFQKLAEMVPFDRSEEYLEKLELIKEQILDSRSEDFKTDDEIKLGEKAFKPEKPDAAKVRDISKYV